MELSQSTIDIFQLYGLQFYINQYYNVSDWNNDGLGDLVIMIGYNEAINDDNYLSYQHSSLEIAYLSPSKI